MRECSAGTFLSKFLTSGLETVNAEHLSGVYPILSVYFSPRAQPYNTVSNHIVVNVMNSYSFSIEDISGSL